MTSHKEHKGHNGFENFETVSLRVLCGRCAMNHDRRV